MVSFRILYVTNNYDALFISVLLIRSISLILTIFHLDDPDGISTKLLLFAMENCFNKI